MKKLLSALGIALMFIPSSYASQRQSAMHLDYKSAEAMLKVIQALHHHVETKAVERLLDEALKFEAYHVSHERYTNPERSKESQVTLSQFRRFMLSFALEQVDTQDNKRLMITRSFYEDAIKNPEKFQKAIRKIRSVPTSRFQDSFELALYWLPKEPELNIRVWILFDIGGSGAWAFRTEDGTDNIGFNILHMLDENGEFDIELFLGILAHEIHHLSLPLSSYLKAINYENLSETSRLKLYSDYMETLMTEGMAMKFCNNAPGVLSPKPYPEKAFAATQLNLKDWKYFQGQLVNIHGRAIEDLRRLLSDTTVEKEKFESDYDDYWTWRAGEKEGRTFTLGRRYYYGSELLGVIYAALGRDAVIEGLLDLREVLLLYNEGVMKLELEDFEQYLFPEDLIRLVNEL